MREREGWVVGGGGCWRETHVQPPACLPACDATLQVPHCRVESSAGLPLSPPPFCLPQAPTPTSRLPTCGALAATCTRCPSARRPGRRWVGGWVVVVVAVVVAGRAREGGAGGCVGRRASNQRSARHLPRQAGLVGSWQHSMHPVLRCMPFLHQPLLPSPCHYPRPAQAARRYLTVLATTAMTQAKEGAPPGGWVGGWAEDCGCSVKNHGLWRGRRTMPCRPAWPLFPSPPLRPCLAPHPGPPPAAPACAQVRLPRCPHWTPSWCCSSLPRVGAGVGRGGAVSGWCGHARVCCPEHTSVHPSHAFLPVAWLAAFPNHAPGLPSPLPYLQARRRR